MATKALTDGELNKEILHVLENSRAGADTLDITFFCIKDKLHGNGIKCTDQELVAAINSLILIKRVGLVSLVFEGKQVDVEIRYPAEKVAAS